ncbi:HNH endonuclease signature motif containing protein [Thermococcus sp. SY098]|uniref:HNH endonuclease n=1 Tax=Thermococcus sp. SY098 TaxID=3111325 RepID=UPI002D7924F4|nr:HNH endonuclease signature motif containing protein [Thermococcus sp. SY098]WRS53289.1 HNH endonuclease signature motif containing protein [Thermococcus sp. SY098]
MGNEGVSPHIRRKILKRDGYKCQNCGYDYLDVHYMDGNIENKNLENLIVLCRQCHYKLHQIEKLRKIKPVLENLLNELFEKPIEIFMDVNFEEVVESFKNRVQREIIREFKFFVKSRILAKLEEKTLREIEKEIEKERTSTTGSLRKIILERYNYRCSECGYGYLEVHHIDGDRLNSNPENLITLCRRCHRKTHSSMYSWTKVEDMDKGTSRFYREFYKLAHKIAKDKEDRFKMTIKFKQAGKSMKINREQFKKFYEIFGHDIVEDILVQWEREIRRYLNQLEWEQQKEMYRNVYFLLEHVLPRNSFRVFVNLAKSGKFDRKTLREAKRILKESLK